MQELFLGLPFETWIMIAVIWAIVFINVILLGLKILKEQKNEGAE